jgi:hypothetical protein
LPGAKKAAGSLLIWRGREGKRRSVDPSPYSLSRDKAFAAHVIFSAETVQIKFSFFARFPWKCYSPWTFKVSVFRYFYSKNVRIKLRNVAKVTNISS